MRKYLIWTIPPIALIAGLVRLPVLRAQTALTPKSVDEIKIDKWNSVPLHGTGLHRDDRRRPLPRRDLSGVWDATGDAGAGGPPAGIQPSGAYEHKALLPGVGNPPGGARDEKGIPNPLPYTALGEATLEAHKPTGLRMRSVPATGETIPWIFATRLDSPVWTSLNSGSIEIVQTKDQTIILNQFFRTWRTIWTDGRELPKDPEPRLYGYSVGKWVDDYTFVVQTVGMSETTWMDKAGRPHSSELKVEERFHRVDQTTWSYRHHRRSQMYTSPWLALNKFPLRSQPRGFDIRELYCAPSDLDQYNKEVGDSLDAGPDK